jgi:GNAT superfamily N-acetyltransferase
VIDPGSIMTGSAGGANRGDSMSARNSMELSLRTATNGDIPQAIELCRVSGWNQLPNDWSRLLDYEPAGCFVATDAGKVVGTVTSTRYGRDLAWIGMMLVHPDYRRHGIATLLMKRVLRYLQDAGVASIRLDATPAGQPVYARLAFTAEWMMQRWQRPGRDATDDLPSESNTEAPTALLLREYRELDRRAFGVDRWSWIERLLPASQVSVDTHALGLLRPGFLADYLGPVIASNASAAHTVIHDLLRRTQQPIFWDIPGPNHAALAIAQALGFAPVRELTRMVWGSHSFESDTDCLFALADPSTG